MESRALLHEARTFKLPRASSFDEEVKELGNLFFNLRREPVDVPHWSTAVAFAATPMAATPVASASAAVASPPAPAARAAAPAAAASSVAPDSPSLGMLRLQDAGLRRGAALLMRDDDTAGVTTEFLRALVAAVGTDGANRFAAAASARARVLCITLKAMPRGLVVADVRARATSEFAIPAQRAALSKAAGDDMLLVELAYGPGALFFALTPKAAALRSASDASVSVRLLEPPTA